MVRRCACRCAGVTAYVDKRSPVGAWRRLQACVTSTEPRRTAPINYTESHEYGWPFSVECAENEIYGEEWG
jgi:hypothetical protein